MKNKMKKLKDSRLFQTSILFDDEGTLEQAREFLGPVYALDKALQSFCARIVKGKRKQSDETATCEVSSEPGNCYKQMTS